MQEVRPVDLTLSAPSASAGSHNARRKQSASVPEVTQFSPGTPCWPGLRSSSTDVAAEFYARLFGWQPAPPAPNDYVIFSLGGKPVAGMGPLLSDSLQPGWCTYVAVHNVDAAITAATRAGGDARVAPLDVFGGRVAVVVDPAGAELWLWQPAGFNGAQLIDESSTMCWNELGARDVEAASAFYRAVFGWTTAGIDYQGSDCLAWILGDKLIGGLVQVDDEERAQLPAHWLVSFAVADVGATQARAVDLGGSPYATRGGTSPGRSDVLQDRSGTLFSIIATSEIPGLSWRSAMGSSDAVAVRRGNRP